MKPMFKPNLDCTIRRRSERNLYGEEVLLDPQPSRCAVVKWEVSIGKSSVRADSTASRGAADEQTAVVVALFSTSVDLAHDDQVEINGVKLRVVGIYPRHSLQGTLDHYSVSLTAWGRE